MGWQDQIFRYCERGLDPGFWAEPFNAWSNLAFLAVALGMVGRLRRLPADRSWMHRAALMLMMLLIAAISVGSFLFHTLATRWAEIADVAPITGFMVLYLAFALHVWIGLGHRAILGIVAVFLAASAVLSRIDCASLPFFAAAGVAASTHAPVPCLNGTLGYAPALLALLATGLCIGRRQPIGRALLMAAATFCCAMTLRWLDQDLCHTTRIAGAARGTHALWHLLNAVTVALLLHAAFETQSVHQPARP